ncbi:MAG: DUF167 domain-containing protein [Betaproteobacteria bacterium]
MPESWYRYDPDRGLLTLFLHVQPNARCTEIAGLHGGQIKVRVAAPAVEGKANDMLLGFLADKFDLPGGRVMIRRGSHGRTKTVEIYGQAASVLARVKELLHS